MSRHQATGLASGKVEKAQMHAKSRREIKGRKGTGERGRHKGTDGWPRLNFRVRMGSDRPLHVYWPGTRYWPLGRGRDNKTWRRMLGEAITDWGKLKLAFDVNTRVHMYIHTSTFLFFPCLILIFNLSSAWIPDHSQHFHVTALVKYLYGAVYNVLLQ